MFYQNFSDILCFHTYFLMFCISMETDAWHLFHGICFLCMAFNSLQNDVCFNHLGQKLWEKIEIDLLQKSVTFQRGENRSKYNNINYV